MSSREKILAAVTANKPAFAPLPDMVLEAEKDPAILLQQFVRILTGIGGRAIEVSSIEAVQQDIAHATAAGGFIVNAIAEAGPVSTVNSNNDALSLETVERAYIRGSLGVAENGAIWVEETNMLNRLLPFICQHLVLVLHTQKLVANMHEAYKQVTVNKEGYGVFIAGPSKTADIEQSLVIGAHGARSLTVYLLQ